MTPACMTATELAMWQEANAALTKNRADAPCRDCPLAFAEAMRAEGRCNGTPGGAGRAIQPTNDYVLARRRRQWREASARARQRKVAA